MAKNMTEGKPLKLILAFYVSGFMRKSISEFL